MAENNLNTEHYQQNNAQNSGQNQRENGSNFGKLFGENEKETNDLKNQFALVQEQILNYEKEISDLKDALLRAIADAENQKKRHAKDLESTAKYGVTSILKDIIDPFEQLFIALSIQIPQELQENEVFKSIFSGIKMTRNLFEKSLAKHGLVRVFPNGEKFNHETQQAISQIPQEGVESGTVINVVQAGYALHGRVIKPALVVVAS
jgi:molecular chaperone GrpE